MNILPTRNRGSERDTWRALVGLEGDFEAAGRSFYWSVTASRGKSTGYVEVFDSCATHLNNALDSVRANGEIVCRINARSEEHTSELQSLMRNSYAVFCLKKKKKNH